MILTLDFRGPRAADVSYLLHKHPGHVTRRATACGEATVFWPHYGPDRAQVALLLRIDSIEGVKRGRDNKLATLTDYVNDRPYTANSFTAVALRECFSTALAGKCDAKPDLLDEVFDVRVVMPAVHAHGGSEVVTKLFAPLGYRVETISHLYDPTFPAWGDSPVLSVDLTGRQTVRAVLRHLYLLMQVMDTGRHYFVDDKAVDVLIRHGAGWVENHPARGLIAKRFVAYRAGLAKDVIEKLDALLPAAPMADADVDEVAAAVSAPEDVDINAAPLPAEDPPAKIPLSPQRMAAVAAQITALIPTPALVVDLGCGEGELLKVLKSNAVLTTTTLIGVDASAWALQRAQRKLKLTRADKRIRLMQGAATHKDARLVGCDVVALVETIEHLEPERLDVLAANVFGFLRPRCVIVTTPNREYNPLYEFLAPGALRHRDHRFEWTRAEFEAWSAETAGKFGYTLACTGIGDVDPEYGAPTQMGVFERE